MKGAEVFVEHLCVFRSGLPPVRQPDSTREVISGPRIYQWFVPRIPPFEVRCGKCGSCQTYRYRHVIVFEAPTFAEFEAHPAFENV